MAKCVAHPDKTGSLSITDMGQGKTRLHCFGGCYQADVLRSAGMTWKDLRPGDVPPEMRRRMSLEDWKESLERQLGLVVWLASLERDKRSYWAAAWKRISADLLQVRLQVEPGKVLQEHRAKRLQERVKKHGWESLWEEVYGGERVPNSSIGTELREGEVRANSLHSGPFELPDGGLQAGRQDGLWDRPNVAAGH